MTTVATDNPTVGIIGAGIGGLSCARQLRAAGFSVRVFDKSREVGGRVSLRRAEMDSSFDHGAQYFTVKDAAMAQQVKRWIAAGVVAPWECRIGSLESGQWKPTKSETTRYVGVPGMTAIAKDAALCAKQAWERRMRCSIDNSETFQRNRAGGKPVQ